MIVLGFIRDCLQTIIDFFTTIWDFITNLINNTILLAEYIVTATGISYETIDSLPDFIKGFATITILVSVLYMILGRESGVSD